MKASHMPFASSAEVDGNHGATKAHAHVDPLSKLLLGDAATAAESWTWTFAPWDVSDDQGRIVYVLPNLAVTKIRASLTGGGYSCVCTIASDLTSKVYTGNNPPLGYKPQGFRLDAKNAQGGVLFSLSWEQVLSCGTNRLYQSQTFDPDTYGIWDICTFSVLPWTHPVCS